MLYSLKMAAASTPRAQVATLPGSVVDTGSAILTPLSVNALMMLYKAISRALTAPAVFLASMDRCARIDAQLEGLAVRYAVAMERVVMGDKEVVSARASHRPPLAIGVVATAPTAVRGTTGAAAH